MNVEEKRLVLEDGLQRLVVFAAPTGSSVICDPPVVETDDDWVVLVSKRDLLTFNEQAMLLGYRKDGEYLGLLGLFQSYRKGRLNLIVVSDPLVYDSYAKATALAKLLNLKDKAHRIALFDAVVRNKFPQ